MFIIGWMFSLFLLVLGLPVMAFPLVGVEGYFWAVFSITASLPTSHVLLKDFLHLSSSMGLLTIERHVPPSSLILQPLTSFCKLASSWLSLLTSYLNCCCCVTALLNKPAKLGEMYLKLVLKRSDSWFAIKGHDCVFINRESTCWWPCFLDYYYTNQKYIISFNDLYHQIQRKCIR